MKPEDFRKEYVWSVDEKDVRVRIVIAEYDDGSCIAVSGCDDESFLSSGLLINPPTRWQHHKPIPEKKIRTMIQKECIIWAVTEGYKGWVVKKEQNNFLIYQPSSFDYDAPEYLLRAKVTDGKIGEWQKFEVEDQE